MGQEKITEALTKLQEDKVYTIIKEQIEAGISAKELLKECRGAMRVIGELFNSGEYFVAELVYAGEIMRNIMNLLSPYLKGQEYNKKVGTVVMGTVKGDIHDLGKAIVILSLQANGFEVIDLGVDVPADSFIGAIKNSGAKVVGMSVFLTSCFTSVVKIVNAIKDAGLRDKVKIMVGGAPVTEMVAEETGCDYFGKDAASGAKYALSVIEA